jgi:1-acyl-sn-glycerol-3-phosphate acyltransferase
MTACKLYLILSAVGVLVWDRFSPLFTQSYGWWAVPLIFIGIFVALVVIQFILLASMVLFTSMKKEPKGEKFFRFLLNHSLPIAFWILKIKVECDGLEKLENPENTFFVCNHQHDFDPAVIYTAFPKSRICFIGKKDIIEELPFIAKAMHLLSGLFIDREHDREAAKTIITAVKYLKGGDKSVAIFPEGRTNTDGTVVPFRNGAFKIALKSGKPIAVCVLENTYSISKNFLRRKTLVRIRLIEVIKPEDYADLNTVQLGDIIHAKMSQNLEELKKQSV